MIISDIIDRKNSIYYSSTDSTLKLKQLAYDAYISLYNKDIESIKLDKLYSKYIELLEKEFPFYIKKKGKNYKIDNLLDSNLKLFEGISIFDSKIENGIIKNETQEIYIGNRKSSYIKKFFIGKLFEVRDLNENKSIIDLVQSYSFNKIIISHKDCDVRVSHLRAFPHYEMGVFMYLNQAKRNLLK